MSTPSPDDPEALAFRDAIEKARRLVALELDLAETRRRLAEDNLRIAEAQLELAEGRIRLLEAENDRLRRDLDEGLGRRGAPPSLDNRGGSFRKDVPRTSSGK